MSVVIEIVQWVLASFGAATVLYLVVCGGLDIWEGRYRRKYQAQLKLAEECRAENAALYGQLRALRHELRCAKRGHTWSKEPAATAAQPSGISGELPARGEG